MGGRYQTTQVYLSGHGTLGSSVTDELIESSGIDAETDSLRALFTILLGGLSLFSTGVDGAATAAVAADLKSKAVPGVFGVLFADPNDANAPDPSPNAEEPPVVGEASPPGVNGETPLNGFLPPWEESPPNRLPDVNVR